MAQNFLKEERIANANLYKCVLKNVENLLSTI